MKEFNDYEVGCIVRALEHAAANEGFIYRVVKALAAVEEVASAEARCAALTQERDAYRKAGAQMHNGLVGHGMAGAFNAALAEDGVRLFDEAEALSGQALPEDAADIQSYKGKYEAVDASLCAIRAVVEQAIPLLRCVRPLDIGAHYCRYCPAKSPAWEHTPSCPYVESEAEYTAARALADRLATLVQGQGAT